ncbi:N-acetyltransferase [Listeria sp. SHR_NRA_18]|uniref:GNAT family N-acetyltransferase n=1 Tax=Listeria TaxID=1637 RepID=UPI00051D8FB1|nr:MULTISPECIES: GNAT family protein [Listeria]KGL44777.1 GNAT family acetyltransferase [Listeriaceae bacterium FSL A5-0209]KMT59565.1 acetyltransferase [Listeria newyorkensis]RQW68626.1 N-acetyltransferase [Listeria sp. SHR_NRA_18]
MGKLETERLLLVEYSLEWIEATIAGVDELERVSGYEVSRDWPGIDFFFYLPYVLESVKKEPEMTKWTHLIVLKEENKVIGEIGGQGKPEETGEIELGYSIVPAYQNNGYVTEALGELLVWLKQQPEIKRIFARSFESNPHSIQVLRKSGFLYQPKYDKTEPRGKIVLWEYPMDEGTS